MQIQKFGRDTTRSPLENRHSHTSEFNEKHFFNPETRMRFSPIQSRTSRRDANFWHSISGFKTRPRRISFRFETTSRNRNTFLMVEREKLKLILTRIPGIENSHWALPYITWNAKAKGEFDLFTEQFWIQNYVVALDVFLRSLKLSPVS